MNAMLSEAAVAKVQDIIIGQLAVSREQVTPDARIVEDLGADSLDVAEIAMKVEEEFSVTLPDELVDRARTFGELCEELGALLKS